MAAFGKLTFGKLSNKTWEQFRPPKRYPSLSGSALFKQVPRVVKPQAAAQKLNNKKKHQQPATPPVSQLPQHKPEEKKNGLNGQNGHTNRPVNPPNRYGQNSSPVPGGRSSNLFPNTPRQNQSNSRSNDRPRPTENPSRSTPGPAPRQESKPLPSEKPASAAPPERSGKPTVPQQGSSNGVNHERRSAWLPSNGTTNRGPSGTPPSRQTQIPLDPAKKEDPTRQPAPPENTGANRDNNFSRESTVNRDSGSRDSSYQSRYANRNTDERESDIHRDAETGARRFNSSPPVRPVEQNKPPAEPPSSPVRPIPENPRPVPVPPARNTPQPEQPVSGMGAQRQPALTSLSSAAMQRILARFPDLPKQSALLGLCDDGLPVMLDLFDPSPGAMAIIGDERDAQVEMLRSVIASAAMRNGPRSVQFVVLTMQPETWQKWITERGFDRHSLGIVSANDESAREWILRLADWTEERRTGRRGGPPVLFIMDTLSFLTRMELDARLNFDWLAREGPIAAIWPIATISTDLASSLGSRLASFRSKVLGYTDDPSLYIRVAGVDPGQTAEFSKRGEFAVQVGENWLRFNLPR